MITGPVIHPPFLYFSKMEPAPHQNPIRFYEIDLLRFLAALSVVFFHYTFRGYAADGYSTVPFLEMGRVTRYGYLGVELFFMISGYVVLLSAQGKTVRQFFTSRVIRLYPAFWVACTLTFLVKCLWGLSAAQTTAPVLQRAGGLQYVYNLTMLHEFLGVKSMDDVYWSLTVEITFYLLIALLIGFQLLRHIDGFILLWMGYMCLPGIAKSGTLLSELFFPVNAPYFAAGMLFYLLQQPAGRTWRRYGLLLVTYALSVRHAIDRAALYSAKFHNDISGLVAAGLVTLFFVLLYLVAFRKVNLSSHSWLMWAGGLTYPLYLVHDDMGFLAFHYAGPLFNKYVLLGLVLTVMLALAFLIHVLVEKRYSRAMGMHLNQWLSRFVGEKAPPAMESSREGRLVRQSA